MSVKASKEALDPDLKKKKSISQLKEVEEECSFQAATESTKGLACWTAMKAMLITQNGGQRP